MITIKKTSYFLVIVMLFSPLFTTFAMDSLHGANDFEFQLVLDQMVMMPQLTTLKSATDYINQKEEEHFIFQEFINKPNHCLRLIKKLAQRFKSSDEDVCKLLTFPQAQKQLALQKQLNTLCGKNESSSKDRKMFTNLIKQGADVNFTATFFGGKITPLIQAIERKNITMIRLLLNTNADPNIGIYKAGTPLICAIRSGNPIMVNILLKAGADPELSDLYNKSPLAIAQQIGNHHIIEMIENKIVSKKKK